MVDLTKKVLSFTLFNGKITGKSKLNLSELFNSLEENLKNHLATIVMNHVGLKINIEENEVQLGNIENLNNYITWLYEKDKYQKSLNNKAKSIIDKKYNNSAKAESL